MMLCGTTLGLVQLHVPEQAFVYSNTCYVQGVREDDALSNTSGEEHVHGTTTRAHYCFNPSLLNVIYFILRSIFSSRFTNLSSLSLLLRTLSSKALNLV